MSIFHFRIGWEATAAVRIQMVVDAALCVTCTVLGICIAVRQARQFVGGKPREHVDKSGGREGVAAPVSKRKKTGRLNCEHGDMAKLMPNESAVSREGVVAPVSKRRRAGKSTCERGSVPDESAASLKVKTDEKAALLRMVKLHAKSGCSAEMALVIEEIGKRFGPVLERMDYHCLIVTLAKAGEPTAAHQWLQRSMEVGVLPPAGAFGSMIGAYGKQGNIVQALELFETMKLEGIETNTVTYSAIMDAWARSGNVEEASKWMRKMLDDGIQPSVVSFGILLPACANAGLLQHLDVWFRLSQKLGLELNSIVFMSVVVAFARKDDLGNAMKWIEIMLEHAVKPDLPGCMLVLASICRTGQVELVDVLIGHMRAAGQPPDDHFLSKCIVQGIQSGHNEKAQRWAEELVASKGHFTWTARKAMVMAELSVPGVGKPGEEARADGGGEKVTPGPDVETEEPAAQRKSVKDIHAARWAAIGHRFSGSIKDFVPGQFGYIICPAIHDLFDNDVYLGLEDNPEHLTKGQRVCFTLRVDKWCGLPRAVQVSPLRPCD